MQANGLTDVANLGALLEIPTVNEYIFFKEQ
jgi:hypothetical protein